MLKPQVQEDTRLEDIVSFYKGHGVDYEAIHAEHYTRYGEVIV